ncbi:MAG: GC-type dockerin domain-anchored protein [Phycisphaerales bacterium]
MRSLTTALVVLASAAALAHGAPEFIAAPLSVPSGQAGARPSVLLFGHIAFEGLDVIQINHTASEQAGAFEENAQSPSSGSHANYSVGLEWDASPARLRALCYSTVDVVTTAENESSEVFAAAELDSPDLPAPRGREPRFTLTEPALVHVSADVVSILDGGARTNNTSFYLARWDEPTQHYVTLYDEAAPTHPIENWESHIDEVVELDAGDYVLIIYVVHLGTAAMIPDIEFAPTMFADGRVRAELRILPGCSLADLASPLGSLDFSDVTAFLVAFAAQSPEADLAPPADQWDFSDIVAFLGSFAEGCP